MAFERFRKRGIFRYNEEQSRQENPIYISERKTQSDLVCCSRCKGFYGRNLFHRHKALCMGDTACVPTGIHMQALSNDSDQFSELILSRLQRDTIGNICRKDQTIILIGRQLFKDSKKNPAKMMDKRKGVMNDMRLLARLFQIMTEEVECESAEDMFLRKNFSTLEKAIEIVTKEDDHLKHGMKNHLYYLILNAHNIIVSHHLSLDNDKRAEEIEKFKRVFTLNKSSIFGDAIYAINMTRQEKLRMPEQEADDEDLTTLSDHLRKNVKDLCSEYEMIGSHEFVALRDTLCARLTLFNARRGGEPARLLISQYADAKSGRWVNPKRVQQLDPYEKELFKEMLITFQPGKGNHLVSDFIPTDCIKGLDILCDMEVRKRAGILEANPYIFANTQGSDVYVLGWNAINKMCKESKVKKPELLTATMQRHRISTMYAALDVPESERQYFYKHMGHTKDINLGTYQYPLPVMAVTKVGRHLQTIDKGMHCLLIFMLS